jgi:O-antigen/teichoic acid export membrane protein
MSEPLTPTEPVASPLATLDATPVLARQTLAYTLSGMLAPAIGVVTLPILARIFSQEEYGLAELGLAVSVVALTLSDAGFTGAAQRSYYDYRDHESDMRRTVLVTAFTATTLLALFVAVAMVVLRNPLSEWVLSKEGDTTLILIIAASVVAGNAVRFAVETMRVRFQAWQYLVTSALAAVAGAALGLTAIVAFDLGVEGLFLGTLTGSLLAAAYGLMVVRAALRGRFSQPVLRTMAAYGVPLIPSLLAAWALALVDRIILSSLEDLQAVGQYAIANRLAGLLLVAMTAFALALQPFLLSLYSDDPVLEKEARGRTLTYFTFALCLGALTLTLFAKEVLLIVAPAFDEAYKAVGPLALAAVGYGLATVLTMGIALARRTIYLSVLSLVSVGVNIGLNFALIPPFGFVGAAVAAAAGYGALAALYYVFAQRMYPTPYEPAKVLSIVTLTGAAALVGVAPVEPLALALGLKLATLAGLVLVLWAARVMAAPEYRELGRFVGAMVPFRPRAAA